MPVGPPDAQGPDASTPAPDRKGRSRPAHARRPRRRRWLWRSLLAVVVLALAVAGAGIGYTLYLNHEVHRITVRGLVPTRTTGATAGTENILLVGSTTRCGLAHQTAAYGLCTQGVTGVNSDVMMILHLNPSTHSVSILSLPRDLFVPNARSTGSWKIDAALAQGPTQLVAAVEEDFAIPIQHYVELNFDTFAAVVTALGGITMDFPDRVFDRESNLDVLVPGCHHLTGVQALQVVRARHLQYWVTGDTTTTPSTWPQEAQSDLARIRRDHEFLRVLATAVAARGLGNPTTDLSLMGAVAPDLTVDSGLSLSDMANLVLTFHSVDVNTAPELTLPVLVGSFGTYVYDGYDYGDVEFPVQPLDRSVVDEFLGVTAGTNTMTGTPLPAPASVTVSVVNGTGITDQATTTASALSALGFQVEGTGSTTPGASRTETRVTYSQRTPAAEAAAELVAGSLSGTVTLAFGQTTDGAEVTVTTGTSFSVDAAVPAPTTTTIPVGHAHSGTHATTTTTAPVAGAGASTTTTAPTASSATTPAGFDPPTTPNPPLASWDPRACPAGEKGTSGSW